MIGRGKSIAHAGVALAYASNKLKAVEIDRQYLHGNTPTEIEQEFRLFQDYNTRCEKNTLAFVLSPTIPDGQTLREQGLRELTRAFIREMKLEEHQFVAYAHRDKAHQHVHLYVNRINFQGKAYDDSFLSNRSSRSAETIALARGLKTARQVQEEKYIQQEGLREVVLKAHTSALTQRPNGIEEYTRLMKEKGVVTLLKRNADGKLIGVQFEGNQGEKIKASDVHRSLSATRLATTLEMHLLNQEKAIKANQAIKQSTPKKSTGPKL
jgi:hypothetical protein